MSNVEKFRSKIIMVDDNITNLSVARNALADEYDVFTAPSGKKLFQLLEKFIPDLILLDIEMPEMDGYEVISILKENNATMDIPVIFLTANIDPESEVKGLNLGAIDYITKPFSRELLLKRIEVHLLVEAQRKELLNYNRNLEKLVSKKTHTIFKMQNAILKTVSELVESRDNITGGHIERTQNYLYMFTNFLLEHNIYTEELSSWDINQFIMSSQLHDVGKISISDRILMKPAKLTDEEFTEMKKHTVYGRSIIEKIEENTPENTFLKHAKIFAVSHHEKWDGTGYPFGLKGKDIPLQGRMMALIDVYDALTNTRPYKEAFSHEDSIKIIRHGNGTHFDPVLCDIFIQHENDFKSCKVSDNIDFQQNLENITWNPVSQVVAAILDARSGTHDGQADRMRRYLILLINALLHDEQYREEVSSWDTNLFQMSAQMYDIGKLAINDDILHKKEQLTQAEYEDVKAHADYGKKIAQQIIIEDTDENSMMHHAEILAGSHHEKWDGSGYPLGLKGRKIPLQGRLMAIVDVYMALTSNRPNRKRISHPEAVDIIKSYSGTYFDPELVSIFLKCEKEISEVESRR